MSKSKEYLIEHKYWERGIPKELVRKIKEVQPRSVTFVVRYKQYVYCKIKTSYGEGFGLAICSAVDEDKFDLNRGKEIAAGRAYKSLYLPLPSGQNEVTCGRIRNDELMFPGNWALRQVRKVIKYSKKFGVKKRYVSFLQREKLEEIRIRGNRWSEE